MNPHEAALIDLISRARRRGSLTMEDLRRELPVDSMTVENLSHVLARLDQAGLDIEIDPALLMPNKTAAQGAAPVATREEAEVSKAMPGGKQESTSLPASVDARVPKRHRARRSDSAVSAPALPWILAFAIVVVAVFAAFAF